MQQKYELRMKTIRDEMDAWIAPDVCLGVLLVFDPSVRRSSDANKFRRSKSTPSEHACRTRVLEL